MSAAATSTRQPEDANPAASARLRLAAIQMTCLDHDASYNRQQATYWIEQARREGAELALLPELMPVGYRLDASLWNHAEPRDGITVRWLQATAASHGIWLATSFLECDGADFYNCFVLVDEAGRIAGRVYKRWPAAVEAYWIRGRKGGHILHTRIGRIGVGICYEALREAWAREIEGKVDLVLLPLSAPLPAVDRNNSPSDRRRFQQLIGGEAAAVAGRLGVPVVLANKCGSWESPLPFPLCHQQSEFAGCSTIADGKSGKLAGLDQQEGICVADIVPGASAPPRRRRGRWSIPVPGKFWMFLIPETLGRISYFLSRSRRRSAVRFAASR